MTFLFEYFYSMGLMRLATGFWLVFHTNCLLAQQRPVETLKKHQSGLEVQAYPAGVMPGLVYQYYVNEKSALHVRLALNAANRRDWGKHDEEKGLGPGFTVGFRREFSLFEQRLTAGLRTDIWQMRIHWKDKPAPPLSF